MGGVDLVKPQKAKRATVGSDAEGKPSDGAKSVIRRFCQGTNARAYEYFGAHPLEDGSVTVRLWAPRADSVSVCGDFNDWNPADHPMEKISSEGIWELCFPPGVLDVGALYKFCIRRGDRSFYKADPFGRSMERSPGTASVLCDTEGYAWRDEGWMHYRKGKFCRGAAERRAINIYELHAGSWKRHEDGSLYSYTDLAADLVTYVKQMGYTHVELLPLMEHPFDGSWGYQICGYYAPTSRYGTPKDLMAFVDTMHEAGIGVILDWVPAHFPKDEHGLIELDGEALYEYEDPLRRETSWGTRYFDVGRPQVQSFLISNAVYWAERFHIDGLRVDAVASMLYLDFDRGEGQWTPNRLGDNRNLEAIAFLQRLNSRMAREFPDVMMIAEESSAWPGVTTFEDGGLGFTLKWNMGWMNDSLSYLPIDPLYRNYHHGKLTFPLTYAHGERYVLPISHDEVVHGKRSLLDRSPREYKEKFASTRAFLTYQMTQPGKKLLFMGSELGQFCEWSEEKPLEWFLLDYDMHARLQLFTSELNHLYLANPALWERDADKEGFQWIDADNADQSIVSYRRVDGKGRELIVLINFLPVDREDFLLAVPWDGAYEEILNSDELRFGGEGRINPGRYRTEPCLLRQYRRAIRIHVPPMSALIFQSTKRPAYRG